MTSETVGEETGFCDMCCAKDSASQADSHLDTVPTVFFTLSVKQNVSFYFVRVATQNAFWGVTLMKKRNSTFENKTSTPLLVPGIPVCFKEVDRNAAVVKLCPTFLCILTWESPWR